MTTLQTPLQPSPAHFEGTTGQLDLGYHWIWTYGHLIPLAMFSLAMTTSILLEGPVFLTMGTAAMALWAAAGFWVMRFVVNMDQLGRLPTALFATGESHVLDLGCGAGRTSIIIARECPGSHIVALDNFSADYITGRQDAHDPKAHSTHGESNTRANFIAAGVSNRIEIRSGDMRWLPCADGEFDGVVSSTAIDHLDRVDIPVALAEANRVLKEHGQLLLWLVVPNRWTFIAFGPLFSMHGPNSDTADWRGMLHEAGFTINDEGTKRGLAWILATRTEDPVATASLAPTKSPISRHLHWIVVGGSVVVAGGILWWAGFETQALWTMGIGLVMTHLGPILLGIGALGIWLAKRHSR
jgi:SAM-dependent methyltransferase